MDSSKKIKFNKTKNRILFLPPTVALGHENEANLRDFNIKDMLGQGAFGQVFKVIHKTSLITYALKVVKKGVITKHAMEKQILNEVRIMYSLKHPNVVSLYNHFEDDDNIYLVIEFCDNGQLYDVLKKKGRFDEKTAAKFMADLVSGLDYIHNQDPPIIHRDIKPENLLISGENTIKLADFGWSNFGGGSNPRSTYAGTPEYLAPEMINETGHSEKLDIWTVGILFFELITGKTPFVPRNAKDKGTFEKMLYHNILNGKINFPSDFPPLARNLVQKLLQANPDNRPGIKEIIAHPWFKSFGLFTEEDIQIRESKMAEIQQSQLLESIQFELDSDEDLRTSAETTPQISKEEAMSFAKRESVLSRLGTHQSVSANQEEMNKSKFIDQYKNTTAIRKTITSQQTNMLKDLSDRVQEKDKLLKQWELKYGFLEKKYEKLEKLTEQLKTTTKGFSEDGKFLSSLEVKKYKMMEEELASLRKHEEEHWVLLIEKDKQIDSLKAEVVAFESLRQAYEKLKQDKQQLSGELKEREKAIFEYSTIVNKHKDESVDQIERLKEEIAEYQHKLNVKTKENQDLIIRELLEHTSQSYDQIKSSIQEYIILKSEAQNTKDRLAEAEYRLKKAEVLTQTKIDTERERLTDEYETKIETLKKDHRADISRLQDSQNKLKIDFHEQIGEKETRIALLEADIEILNSKLNTVGIKQETIDDLRKLLQTKSESLAEKEIQISSLNSALRSLEQKIEDSSRCKSPAKQKK